MAFPEFNKPISASESRDYTNVKSILETAVDFISSGGI
jgi:hypothetical protein